MSFFSDIGKTITRVTNPGTRNASNPFVKYTINPIRQAIRYSGAATQTILAPVLTAQQQRQAFGLTPQESKYFEIGSKVSRGVIAAGATVLGGAYLAGVGPFAASKLAVPGFNTALTPPSPDSGPFTSDTSVPYANGDNYALGPYSNSSAVAASAAIGAEGAGGGFSGLLGGVLGGLGRSVGGLGSSALGYIGLSKLLGGSGGAGSSGGPGGGSTTEVGGTSNTIIPGESGGGYAGTGYGGGPGGLLGYIPGGQTADRVLQAAGLPGGIGSFLMLGALLGMAWYLWKGRKKK